MPPKRGNPCASTGYSGRSIEPSTGCALGNNHDREQMSAQVSSTEMDANVLKVERSLGDQDQVGSAGEACRHGDPSPLLPITSTNMTR